MAAPTTRPSAGDIAEFSFTISNHTGIDYSDLILRVYLSGRKFVDSYTYRIDDAGQWSILDVPASDITPITLPGPSGFAVPAGTEQTHRLCLELAREPTEPITYGAHLLDTAHGTDLQLVTGRIR